MDCVGYTWLQGAMRSIRANAELQRDIRITRRYMYRGDYLRDHGGSHGGGISVLVHELAHLGRVTSTCDVYHNGYNDRP